MEHPFLMFLDHTQRRSTVGRTPLDEWSACRWDLYLTTHDTHNRQISMPPVGFKHTISVGERPQAARLRPRGHWDRQIDRLPLQICTKQSLPKDIESSLHADFWRQLIIDQICYHVPRRQTVQNIERLYIYIYIYIYIYTYICKYCLWYVSI